ncbi:hypothetical protein FXN61_45905 [Lentzea sp. PSKA42]|uniref:PBP domain-containing protein n=2 Tax=Lentzea indica TaxID=2604800 RepID=A0ABX1FXZ3_9PSEU|nr:hypothetical protein [Lentzea indica]
MDTTVNGQVESKYGGVLKTLLQQEAGKQLDSPSFVLLRVENNGATTIAENDYTVPDAGMEVVFPGRKVVGLAVTELSDDSMRGTFESDDPGKGLDRTDRADAPGLSSGIVKLPKVTLNRGWHYKVLVLLERVHEKHPRPTTTQVVAGVKGGTVRQTHNRTGIGNWKDIGGNDLPVRLVSRDPDSGTRKTFQGQVLSGKREPGTNSDDCKQLDSGALPGVIRCERPTTNDVLNTVAVTPGAIGYSELGAVTHRQDVVPVRISGHEATLEGAVHAAYPFWQTEYAYTFGEPKADSPAASFLRYLTNQVGRDVIRSHGNRPCGELKNPVLCRPE